MINILIKINFNNIYTFKIIIVKHFLQIFYEFDMIMRRSKPNLTSFRSAKCCLHLKKTFVVFGVDGVVNSRSVQ